MAGCPEDPSPISAEDARILRQAQEGLCLSLGEEKNGGSSKGLAPHTGPSAYARFSSQAESDETCSLSAGGERSGRG